MPILRMRENYIKWSAIGRKSATTRLHPKKINTPYELTSGDRFHPKKSGVFIKIFKIMEWTLDTISEEDKDLIFRAEGFLKWDDFWAVLKDINKHKLKNNTPLWTHFYEVLQKVG